MSPFFASYWSLTLLVASSLGHPAEVTKSAKRAEYEAIALFLYRNHALGSVAAGIL